MDICGLDMDKIQKEVRRMLSAPKVECQMP
jgi:hypothetical protein